MSDTSDALSRAIRDLEAAEARVKRDAERVHDETRAKLIVELLPVLDNLDRTIRAAEDATDASLLQGVQMVRDQLEGVLLKYGLERIDATGQRFDPNLHEAVGVLEVTDPRSHGLVLEQVQPGYAFGGRLMRAAKVYVARYTPRHDADAYP